METAVCTGTIREIRNYGTVVVLWVDSGDGQTLPIPMDHRPFGWLLDGEDCTPDDLAGRRVSFDGRVVSFLDGE